MHSQVLRDITNDIHDAGRLAVSNTCIILFPASDKKFNDISPLKQSSVNRVQCLIKSEVLNIEQIASNAEVLSPVQQ